MTTVSSMTPTPQQTRRARGPARMRPALRRLAARAALAFCVAAMTPVVAEAQNPFSAAATVNNDVVTYFEIAQRETLMEILRAPPDERARVLDILIDERLQRQVADAAGLLASEEEIEEGVEAFATRANLSAEQLVRQLASSGVAPETFRDFIANGINWRNVVRARYGAQAQITPEEVTRALEQGNISAGERVRLAEIVIPVNDENRERLTTELGRLADQVQGDRERFSQAASRFSAVATRENGGLTDWRPLGALPGPIAAMVRAMSPGDVSEVVSLGPAIAIFQLRGLEEVMLAAPRVSAVDYATIALPGGRTPETLAEAARLRNEVDTCDDLFGALPGGFERNTVPLGEIPDDIAVALSRLDENEMATDVTRADGRILLVTMLCERQFSVAEDTREEVRARLFQQRLETLSTGFLDELRADAIIRYDNR